MIISIKALETQLSLLGFGVSYHEGDTGETVFVRRTGAHSFHRVSTKSNRSGTALSAGIEISIVPGRTALKSLCIYRPLTCVAADRESCTTPINSENDVCSFIERVVENAPHEVEILAKNELNRLLSNTFAAREASEKYLAMIDELGNDEINSVMSTNVAAEIDRIKQQRYVMIPDGAHFYDLALKAIAFGCDKIEGDPNWLHGRDADAWDDRELMIRLQFMASRLANENGWNLGYI